MTSLDRPKKKEKNPYQLLEEEKLKGTIAKIAVGTALFSTSLVGGYVVVESSRGGHSSGNYLTEDPTTLNGQTSPFSPTYNRAGKLVTLTRRLPFFTTETKTLPGSTSTEVLYLPPDNEGSKSETPPTTNEQPKKTPTTNTPTPNPEKTPTPVPSPAPTPSPSPAAPSGEVAPGPIAPTPITETPIQPPTTTTESAPPPTTTETTPPPDTQDNEPAPDHVEVLEDGTIKQVYGEEGQPESKVVLTKLDGTIITTTIDENGKETTATHAPDDKL